MIELNKDSYIVGIWFSCNSKIGMDWLACAMRDPEDKNKFKSWMRFRGNSEGKRWSTFEAPAMPEQELIDLMRSLQDEIEPGYPEKDEIIVKGGLDKFLRLTKNKDWFNLHPAH